MEDRDHFSASYGYSVSTTVAQLARAYTPFANKGEIKNLRLFKNDPIKIGQRVLSIETYRGCLKNDGISYGRGRHCNSGINSRLSELQVKQELLDNLLKVEGYGKPGERKYNASFVGHCTMPQTQSL